MKRTNKRKDNLENIVWNHSKVIHSEGIHIGERERCLLLSFSFCKCQTCFQCHQGIQVSLSNGACGCCLKCSLFSPCAPYLPVSRGPVTPSSTRTHHSLRIGSINVFNISTIIGSPFVKLFSFLFQSCFVIFDLLLGHFFNGANMSLA